MIPGSASPLLLSSTAVIPDPFGPSYTGLQISRSVRFNPDDSATFTRAFSSGNQLLWTWSAWVKRTALGEHILFGTQTSGSDIGFIGFGGDDTLGFNNKVNDTTGYGGGTIAKFRDLSSWYHIMFVFDGAQAVYTNRAKIYVNGTLSTLNADSLTPGPGLLNSALTHALGARFLFGGTSIHTAAYMADVYFIDGQALTPSSFGQTDTAYGNQWVPIAYSGSYGTNGFSLKFSDNSAATSSTLGNDSSSNNNDWTPNNMSVTAGAGNDSLVDSPTNYGTDTGVGGEVRGNYCTWNPLDKSGSATYSNGNLDAFTGASGYGTTRGTIAISSGKWYWECTFNSTDASNDCYFGILDITGSLADNLGGNAKGYAYWAFNGNKANNGSYSAYGSSYVPGDVIGVALNLDAGSITFYKNGVSQGTAFSSLSGTFAPAFSDSGGSSIGLTANFGQRPFIYTAPSGFQALCTTNLLLNAITTTGSFTGNASTNGPFVFLKGVPTAMSINSNAVTFGTHANKLSNGFKVISSSGSYNTSGSNSYSITTTGDKFKYARAQPNP
jgi:hypothetical protein